MPEQLQVSVSAAVRAAARALSDAGIDSAVNDARLLMGYALAKEQGAAEPISPASFSDVFIAGDKPAPPIFNDWAQRRAQREPLQHIVGATTFFGYDFLVSPDAFIPRPETELLVEWGLQQLQSALETADSSDLMRNLHDGELTVIDLCSGPGTVALAMAGSLANYLAERRKHNPEALSWVKKVTVTGIEIDEAAVALARKNLQVFRERGWLDGVDCEINFIQGDIQDRRLLARHGLVSTGNVVLANPPYVPEESETDEETRSDPQHAVFGGKDGMALMPDVLWQAVHAASPLAVIGVEHDEATGELTAAEFEEAGAVDVQQHQDLVGRDRFVTGVIRRDPGYIPPRPQTRLD